MFFRKFEASCKAKQDAYIKKLYESSGSGYLQWELDEHKKAQLLPRK